MNRFRVYCGPTLVGPLAERLTPHTGTVTEGTEHVYCTCNYTVYELLTLLNTVMSGYTLRDVQYLGTV